MRRLSNAVKAHAAGLDAQAAAPRYGTVQSVNAADCNVRVLLQPEGVLSGWLPVLMPALGPGWGVVALPAVQQQVLVLAEYDDAESGVVVGAAASQPSPAPSAASLPGGAVTPAQPGEVLLVGAAGAVVRLCADGTIYLQAPLVRVAGDLMVQGEVSDRHGSLDRLRGCYDAHVHAGVRSGPDSTGGVSRPDAE